MIETYSEKVMENFRHPKNVGRIKDADGIGEVGNPTCGDILTLYIKVEKNNEGKEYIKDIKFNTLGCLPPEGEISKNEGEWTEIKHVKKGDEVLNSEGNRVSVLKTYVRDYSGEMLRFIPFVSTWNSFEVTPEHPILCVKRDWCKSARRSSSRCNWKRINNKEIISTKPDFVDAKDVKVSDYLVFVPNSKIVDNPSLTTEIMKILGYYLSEGYCVSSNNVLYFSLNKNEKDKISELKSLLFEITGKEAKERTRRNVTEVYICSKKWGDFFVSLGGKYATEKKVADNVLILPFEKQWQMILTYIKGDWNLYKRRLKDSSTYRISTASKSMAIQLQEILARGRIFASIKKDSRPRNEIEGRIVSSNPIYEISFKLEKKHKFVHSNKNYFLVPVRKIEKKNYSGKVYNFEVEGEPHSYLTKGFAVHNCAAAIAVSSMITQMAKGKSLEKAEKISNADIVKELQGLPAVKHHCSLLGADALHLAIKNYRSKNKKR